MTRPPKLQFNIPSMLFITLLCTRGGELTISRKFQEIWTPYYGAKCLGMLWLVAAVTEMIFLTSLGPDSGQALDGTDTVCMNVNDVDST
jgi:hypothetical protein